LVVEASLSRNSQSFTFLTPLQFFFSSYHYPTS
jgi:hypothetical protein